MKIVSYEEQLAAKYPQAMEDNLWWWRQQDRFARGTLKRFQFFGVDQAALTPAQRARLDLLLTLMAVHYPQGQNRPGVVAYTPSALYGQKDKVRTCKAGAFLTSFMPDLSTAQIQLIAETSSPGQLVILPHTRIVEGYLGCGLHSCMTGAFPDQDHPCSVFQDGWEMALLLADVPGCHPLQAKQRTLLYNKHFGGMIYGRTVGNNSMETGLRALGYTPYPHPTWEGAKIAKIPLPFFATAAYDCFAMPSLDGIQSLRNEEDHFIIARRGSLFCNASGKLRLPKGK